MPRGNVRTIPDPDGEGWVNEVDGRVQTRHRMKDVAIQEGRRIAKNNRAEHVIHNKDGTSAQKNSYGPDPYPPKG